MNKLQQELAKLKEKRNNKVNRKLSNVIALVACNNGLSIEQLQNNKAFINKKRKEIEIEVDKKFKREIARLEVEVKNHKEENVTKIIKVKPKPVELKSKEKTPKKKTRYTNLGKFTQDEIDFIEQKSFKEQMGYKMIARLLDRDATLVRKQVASMMAKIVS